MKFDYKRRKRRREGENSLHCPPSFPILYFLFLLFSVQEKLGFQLTARDSNSGFNAGKSILGRVDGNLLFSRGDQDNGYDSWRLFKRGYKANNVYGTETNFHRPPFQYFITSVCSAPTILGSAVFFFNYKPPLCPTAEISECFSSFLFLFEE